MLFTPRKTRGKKQASHLSGKKQKKSEAKKNTDKTGLSYGQEETGGKKMGERGKNQKGKKKRKTKQKDSCYSKALRAHFQMRHSTSVHMNK